MDFNFRAYSKTPFNKRKNSKMSIVDHLKSLLGCSFKSELQCVIICSQNIFIYFHKYYNFFMTKISNLEFWWGFSFLWHRCFSSGRALKSNWIGMEQKSFQENHQDLYGPYSYSPTNPTSLTHILVLSLTTHNTIINSTRISLFLLFQQIQKPRTRDVRNVWSYLRKK